MPVYNVAVMTNVPVLRWISDFWTTERILQALLNSKTWILHSFA